jgi:cytochrome c biogenesis protein CcmG/thiol:disulfide interchange protein DsbE
MSDSAPTRPVKRVAMRRLTALGTVIALLPMLTSPAATGASADDLLDLAAFRGQVVYVDFWASWCAPCRRSFPWMSRMQGELGADGLLVIAVNVDHAYADAEHFLEAHIPHFGIVFDPDGLLREKFGVTTIPTSFLIDRSGRIQWRHEGFRLRDREVLERQIRSLLLAH